MQISAVETDPSVGVDRRAWGKAAAPGSGARGWLLVLPPTATVRATVSGTDPPAAGCEGDPGPSRAPLSRAEWKPTLCQYHIPGQAPFPASQRVIAVFSTGEDLLAQPWHLQHPLLPSCPHCPWAWCPYSKIRFATGRHLGRGRGGSFEAGRGWGDSWVGPTHILPA